MPIQKIACNVYAPPAICKPLSKLATPSKTDLDLARANAEYFACVSPVRLLTKSTGKSDHFDPGIYNCLVILHKFKVPSAHEDAGLVICVMICVLRETWSVTCNQWTHPRRVARLLCLPDEPSLDFSMLLSSLASTLYRVPESLCDLVKVARWATLSDGYASE